MIKPENRLLDQLLEEFSGEIDVSSQAKRGRPAGQKNHSKVINSKTRHRLSRSESSVLEAAFFRNSAWSK